MICALVLVAVEDENGRLLLATLEEDVHVRLDLAARNEIAGGAEDREDRAALRLGLLPRTSRSMLAVVQ